MITEFEENYPKTNRTILPEDDIELEQLLTVYNLKLAPNEPHNIMGQAFIVKNICLPFLIVHFLDNPNHPQTLDTRFLNFMRITPEFALAQQPTKKTKTKNDTHTPAP